MITSSDLRSSNQPSVSKSTSGLTSVQLSYSTADVERSVFFGEEQSVAAVGEPLGDARIWVINDDPFLVEEDATPEEAVPLTEGAGVFRLADPE